MVSRLSTIIDTHLQIVIFFLNKEDKGTRWKLWMSNEPLFKVLIEVFTKCYKFVLQQIIDGSEWRLHSFHKINGAIVWVMLGQPFIFSNTSLNSWYWEGISCGCGSTFGEGRTYIKNASPLVATFMKAIASINKSLGHLGLLVPSTSSFCFKLSMLLIRVSHSRASCYGVSKWKLFVCQSIHE